MSDSAFNIDLKLSSFSLYSWRIDWDNRSEIHVLANQTKAPETTPEVIKEVIIV